MASKYLDSPAKRERLREAVMVAYSAPWPEASWVPGPNADVLLGICASDVRLGVRALRDWCEALEIPFLLPTSRVPDVESLERVSGSIYIKYNPKTALCYVSKYVGKDRGVLLQLGGRQFGHLPLGMFDEKLSKPAPDLVVPSASTS